MTAFKVLHPWCAVYLSKHAFQILRKNESFDIFSKSTEQW